jgi:dTDP-4-amino-4,6-dideoxygalactose transaminase
MFENGRDVAAGHFTNTANSPQFEEFYRDCPNSEKVEKELFYLPTYPRYSSDEVRKNIEVIKHFFTFKLAPANIK